MNLDDDAAVRRLLNSTRQFEQELAQVNADLSALTAQGVAGGGAVQLTINSQGLIEELVISPVAADPGNARGLADLIVSAFQDARRALAAQHQARLLPVLQSITTELRYSG